MIAGVMTKGRLWVFVKLWAQPAGLYKHGSPRVCVTGYVWLRVMLFVILPGASLSALCMRA